MPKWYLVQGRYIRRVFPVDKEIAGRKLFRHKTRVYAPHRNQPLSHTTQMQTVTLVGMLAGILTTVAFLPQVLKTWRTRSAEDISSGMLSLFGTGLVLWLIYGVAIGSMPIILANLVTLLLTFSILFMKWRFANSRRDVIVKEKSKLADRIK